MKTVKEYLDKNYPINGKSTWPLEPKREEVERVSLQENIEGDLDLRDFPNLKVLDFYGKEIYSIDVSNNKKLEIIDIFSNYKLKGDLNIFSNLNELKKLNIANCLFIGNLKSLQNCTKLEKLHIYGTKIKAGLEYLPLDNLKEFWCDGELKEMLEPFDSDIFAWKIVNHPNLVSEYEKTTKITETEARIKKLEKVNCDMQCGYTWHATTCLVERKQKLKTKLNALQGKNKASENKK